MSAEVSLTPDPSNSPLLALAGANFSRKESTRADVAAFTSLLEPLITSAEFSRTDLQDFLRKAVDLKITRATIHSGLEMVLRAQVRVNPARVLEVYNALPHHILTVNPLDRGVRASLLLDDVKGAKNMIAAFDEAMRLYARFIGLKSGPKIRTHYDKMMDSLIERKWLQSHHRVGFENLMKTASQISTARLRVKNIAST